MSNYRGDRYNSEGYYDPTPYQAIQRVTYEEQQRSRKSKEPRRVYIASPYRGDCERNVQNALRYCRFAVAKGYFPLAPHCYLPRFMDDDNPAERKLALSFGLRFLSSCRELWVFGERISDGMKGEIAAARARKIRIRQFTENCKEVYPKC
jgi:hypothetical protein